MSDSRAFEPTFSQPLISTLKIKLISPMLSTVVRSDHNHSLTKDSAVTHISSY